MLIQQKPCFKPFHAAFKTSNDFSLTNSLLCCIGRKFVTYWPKNPVLKWQELPVIWCMCYSSEMLKSIGRGEASVQRAVSELVNVCSCIWTYTPVHVSSIHTNTGQILIFLQDLDHVYRFMNPLLFPAEWTSIEILDSLKSWEFCLLFLWSQTFTSVFSLTREIHRFRSRQYRLSPYSWISLLHMVAYVIS